MLNLSNPSELNNVTDMPIGECGMDLQKAELPILLVLSIALNGASLFILTQIKWESNLAHHYLITTLALNDLIATLLFTFMWIGNVMVWGKFGGDFMCSFLGWFATAMVIWSAWVVVIMSGVRYLSVVKPLYYKLKVTIFTIRCGLLATVLPTFALLAFPFTGLARPYKLYRENYVCAYDFAPGAGGTLHRVWLGLLSGLGLVTLTTMLYLNGSTICTLRRARSVKPFGQTIVSGAWEKRNSFANLQTKAIAFGFCFCYGPFLVRLMHDVMENSAGQSDLRHSVTMALLFMSPLLNPLIYAVYDRSFRQYIVDKSKLVRGKCRLTTTHEVNVVSRTEASAAV